MSHPHAIHLCGWPDCRRPVPLEMWGCKRHWYALPKELRDAIWSGYRKGRLSPEWIAANGAALEWINGMPARIAAMNLGRDTPVPGTGGSDVDLDAKDR